MNFRQINQLALLNDQFRKGEPTDQQLSLSPKVEALPETQKQKLLETVKKVDFYLETPVVSFLSFHSLGLVMLDDTEYLWEIDYYDKSCKSLSPDPTDPNCTTRILTVLERDEY